uniref:Uncharacterized protein n=1 Tax=Haptolina brevifila TaxID=156173 RepID=A0A7S2HEE7_9EUKA
MTGISAADSRAAHASAAHASTAHALAVHTLAVPAVGALAPGASDGDGSGTEGCGSDGGAAVGGGAEEGWAEEGGAAEGGAEEGASSLCPSPQLTPPSVHAPICTCEGVAVPKPPSVHAATLRAATPSPPMSMPLAALLLEHLYAIKVCAVDASCIASWIGEAATSLAANPCALSTAIRASAICASPLARPSAPLCTAEAISHPPATAPRE